MWWLLKHLIPIRTKQFPQTKLSTYTVFFPQCYNFPPNSINRLFFVNLNYLLETSMNELKRCGNLHSLCKCQFSLTEVGLYDLLGTPWQEWRLSQSIPFIQKFIYNIIGKQALSGAIEIYLGRHITRLR